MNDIQARLKMAKQAYKMATNGKTAADVACDRDGDITQAERDEYVRIEKKIWRNEIERLESQAGVNTSDGDESGSGDIPTPEQFRQFLNDSDADMSDLYDQIDESDTTLTPDDVERLLSDVGIDPYAEDDEGDDVAFDSDSAVDIGFEENEEDNE